MSAQVLVAVFMTIAWFAIGTLAAGANCAADGKRRILASTFVASAIVGAFVVMLGFAGFWQ